MRICYLGLPQYNVYPKGQFIFTRSTAHGAYGTEHGARIISIHTSMEV